MDSIRLAAGESTNCQNPINAQILVTYKNGFLDINAVCHSLIDESSLRYELRIVRKGPKGNSDNTQQGIFKISAGEKRNLSYQRINYRAGDNMNVSLIIQKDNRILSEKHLHSDAIALIAESSK